VATAYLAVEQAYYRPPTQKREIILVACNKCEWRAAFARDELIAAHGAAQTYCCQTHVRPPTLGRATGAPGSVPPETTAAAAARKMLYYRDPSGAPYWSAEPKQDANGHYL